MKMRLGLLPLLALGARGFRLSRLLPKPLSVDELSADMTVIPTLYGYWESRPSMLERRAEMMAAGLYPGVDYKVCDVSRATDDKAMISLQPAYALVEKLEREDWPITVSSCLAPRWFLPSAYNQMVAGFALTVAVVWLGLGVRLAVSHPGPDRLAAPTCRVKCPLMNQLRSYWQTLSRWR